jgi:hypothetical protein
MGVRVPRDGEYRGVELYAGQSAERIENVAKPAIDHVLDVIGDDVERLDWFAVIRTNPPEARLIAKARAVTLWHMHAEERLRRPGLSIEKILAAAPGLDDIDCYDPNNHWSDLDPPPSAIVFSKK